MRPFPAERYGAVRSGAADAAAVAQLADKLLFGEAPGDGHFLRRAATSRRRG